MIQVSESIAIKKKQHIELKALLHLYPDWQAWFQSENCPLKIEECLAIDYYYLHGNHIPLAMKLVVTRSRANQIFIKAIRKLKLHRRHYFQWQAKQLLISPEYVKILGQEFLEVPFSNCYFSTRLLNALDISGFKKWKDIKFYSKKRLLKRRGFGKKCLMELEAFIESKVSCKKSQL